MNKLLFLLSFILLLGITPAVDAQQLAFKKTAKGGQTRFDYRWVDQNNTPQQLNFTIANKVLFSRFRHFRAYQSKTVQRTILVALQKETAKLDPKKIKVDFINRPHGIEIQATGTDQKLMTATLNGLNKIRDKIQADYLTKNYYDTLTDNFGKTGVKPHHARFAKESRSDMKPIVDAILAHRPQLKGRQLAEFILGFVQSIPYSTLESRRESNGAGFSPPLRLLNNNQGDCDSKVTLMASIFNAIYPRSKVAIIYLPEHALIGVQMGHRGNDKYIKIEGRNFILAEPTGPGMIPFAKIAKSSEYFIDGQQYNYQFF